MLFKQFVLDEFLPFASTDKSQTYKSDLKPISEFFGEMEFSAITPLLIERFKRQRMSTVSRFGKPLAPATVNHELMTLSRVCGLARQAKLIRRNPCRKVKLLQLDNERKRYLSKEEEVRLMETLQGKTWLKRIVVFALHTGMRRGEIVNLKWSDVDLKENILRVQKSKSGRSRVIPVNQPARNVLLDILLEREEKTEKIFLVSGNSITSAFMEARIKAGLTDFRFHDLRHTFASRLAMHGQDIITLAELLGHADINMTKRYTHASDESKRKAVEMLE